MAVDCLTPYKFIAQSVWPQYPGLRIRAIILLELYFTDILTYCETD